MYICVRSDSNIMGQHRAVKEARLGSVSSAASCFRFVVVSTLLVFVLILEEERVAGEAAINRGPDHPNLQRPISSRKLLQSAGDGGDMNRIGGSSCSKGDIVIYQYSTSPMPQGIPIFTVQILNVCASDCTISNIHISCGWFSSVRLVNPRVFRRVYYDDCLVNDGNSLGPGQSLSFQYSNSFKYPMSVSSADCE